MATLSKSLDDLLTRMESGAKPGVALAAVEGAQTRLEKMAVDCPCLTCSHATVLLFWEHDEATKHKEWMPRLGACGRSVSLPASGENYAGLQLIKMKCTAAAEEKV